MAKRRGNNEGTIYQLPSGKFRVQASLQGRRISKSFQTANECRAWLRETLDHIDAGLSFDGATIRVVDYLMDWLVTIRSSRRPSTVEVYQRAIEKEIAPDLGALLLKDLKPDILQRFYAQKLREGKSNHAVHSLHKVLRAALQEAVKLKILARNPAKATSPPKVTQKEMRHLDENQAQILLHTAGEIQDQYFPLYNLALHTGMRQAELIGLQWKDIDWGKKRLHIRRQCVRLKGGGYEFREPKSTRGKRTLVIGQSVLDVLQKQSDNIWHRQIRASENWADLDLVFPTRVGTPIVASNLRRAFRKLLAISGLPKIRFHDLRHTAASLMLGNGMDLLVVSRLLGHAKPSITLDVYGHMMPGKQEEVAELMDGLLSLNNSKIAPKMHTKSKVYRLDQQL